MLGVRRRGEQPTDLLRAQAARLAGRDELLGKIVAFQCDLEEEPQCSGADTLAVPTDVPIDASHN